MVGRPIKSYEEAANPVRNWNDRGIYAEKKAANEEGERICPFDGDHLAGTAAAAAHLEGHPNKEQKGAFLHHHFVLSHPPGRPRRQEMKNYCPYVDDVGETWGGSGCDKVLKGEEAARQHVRLHPQQFEKFLVGYFGLKKGVGVKMGTKEEEAEQEEIFDQRARDKFHDCPGCIFYLPKGMTWYPPLMQQHIMEGSHTEKVKNHLTARWLVSGERGEREEEEWDWEEEEEEEERQPAAKKKKTTAVIAAATASTSANAAATAAIAAAADTAATKRKRRRETNPNLRVPCVLCSEKGDPISYPTREWLQKHMLKNHVSLI